MAYTIPEIEPLEAFAGDRWQWKRTNLSEFPADEWTLTYYLRSSDAGGQIDIAATADGDNYSIDVPTTTTEAFTPGTYFWSAFVTQSGDRKLIAQGRLVIKPNPVDITQPVDGRSHARRTLDAINAVIERRATTDQQRYVFQAVGRSVDRMPISDLLKFRDYYAGLVATEEAREAIARGEATGKNILIRFNQPR